MRRARAGRVAPVLLVAEHQTAGRGRLGRDWHSDTGTGANSPGSGSLTFSLGLPLAPRNWSGLSLAVGVSIVRSLHPDLQLKWPNDIWWQRRKLAGILIETAGSGDVPVNRYAVVGIGINIKEQRAAGLTRPPAWLREVLPGISAPQALWRIAAPLVQALKVFEAHGFLPFQAGFTERDALGGATVSLSDGTTGIAQGVDSVGALQLHTTQGLKKINSSEVSVRPLNPLPFENL